MPRMPKYLKEEWAFFLDELGLSAEDAFSASAPRMGRPNDREEAATDFIRSLLLGGRRLASDWEWAGSHGRGRPAYLIEVLREVKGGKPLPTTSLQRSRKCHSRLRTLKKLRNPHPLPFR